MIVGIIGAGVVGSAIAAAYHRAGVRVYLSDPKLGSDSTPVAALVNGPVDIIYVCVGSPALPTGACDTSTLETVINELVALGYSGPVVCKTTAPPEVYQRLQQQCPTLIHSPEFLRQHTALVDVLTPQYIIYGGDRSVAEKVHALDTAIFADVIRLPTVFYTSIESAALFKYLRNSFLASKVTFLNEFYELAQNLGISWQEVSNIIFHDPAFGNSHNHVPGPDNCYGWAGGCFPKDLDAVRHMANMLGVPVDQLSATIKANARHRVCLQTTPSQLSLLGF